MYKIFKYGRYGRRLNGYGESILSRQTPVVMSLPTDPLDAYQPNVYIIGGAEPTLKERSIPIVDTDTTVEVIPEESVVEYVPTEEIEEIDDVEVLPAGSKEESMSPSDLATWERPMTGDEYQGDADIVQVTESDLEGKSWWNWKSFGIGVGAGVGFFGLIWLFSRGSKKGRK